MAKVGYDRNLCVCVFQGLFYRVVGGDVSPFRLVRLSAEELLSKEISEWRKPHASEVSTDCFLLLSQTCLPACLYGEISDLWLPPVGSTSWLQRPLQTWQQTRPNGTPRHGR